MEGNVWWPGRGRPWETEYRMPGKVWLVVSVAKGMGGARMSDLGPGYSNKKGKIRPDREEKGGMEEMGFKEIDVLLQMNALICEREGMVADNMQRASQGYSMAYECDSFMILAARFEQLREILKK